MPGDIVIRIDDQEIEDIFDYQFFTMSDNLILTVLRDGEVIMPDGNFELKADDRVFVTASKSNLSDLLENLGIISRKVKRVLICGGGSAVICPFCGVKIDPCSASSAPMFSKISRNSSPPHLTGVQPAGSLVFRIFATVRRIRSPHSWP